MTQLHHDNIFKSMKDMQFEDTISHECGVTMNESVESRAIAEVMAEKPGITVTYMPAMIRIDGEGKITFRMSEISEALGREMTPYLFEICTSTHYGRMVMVDDDTVVLFGDLDEALKYIGPDGRSETEETAMYRTKSGEEIFIIDGHTHNWNATKDNIKNIHGQQFIDCFYGYHMVLSPKDQVWPKEKFDRYGPEQMYQDLFVDGPDDMAILQCTYLTDFYKEGFNTIEQNAVMKDRAPDRIILNGAFDPRDGEAGLDALEAMAAKYKIKGVKLYTAEWRGDSRGYKLTDPWAYRYLEKAQQLGIKNIHVHKGPTIIPLDRDAFDVADVDHVATDFQGLNFIVEHCGLPRLDDFCWIAVQETNVYGGLAVALPFIHARRDYFTNVISELLFWLGEDKLLFGSDYEIWTPRWLVEQFMAYELPEEVKQAKGVDLTLQAKKKILGLNAARLYGIDVEAQKQKIANAREKAAA